MIGRGSCRPSANGCSHDFFDGLVPRDANSRGAYTLALNSRLQDRGRHRLPAASRAPAPPSTPAPSPLRGGRYAPKQASAPVVRCSAGEIGWCKEARSAAAAPARRTGGPSRSVCRHGQDRVPSRAYRPALPPIRGAHSSTQRLSEQPARLESDAPPSHLRNSTPPARPRPAGSAASPVGGHGTGFASNWRRAETVSPEHMAFRPRM